MSAALFVVFDCRRRLGVLARTIHQHYENARQCVGRPRGKRIIQVRGHSVGGTRVSGDVGRAAMMKRDVHVTVVAWPQATASTGASGRPVRREPRHLRHHTLMRPHSLVSTAAPARSAGREPPGAPSASLIVPLRMSHTAGRLAAIDGTKSNSLNDPTLGCTFNVPVSTVMLVASTKRY